MILASSHSNGVVFDVVAARVTDTNTPGIAGKIRIITISRENNKLKRKSAWCCYLGRCNILNMLNLIVTALLLVIGVVLAESSVAADAVMPAYVLQLPESVDTVLIAETASGRLHRYVRVGDGLEHRADHYISIGENGVRKERAWDRRTPLGIYFANEQLDTTRMHEKYGATAFSLDYPNTWDQVRARSGDGIWIHGVDRRGGVRPPLDTDGCIALPNADLLELESHLRLLVTPVIITEHLQTSSVAKIKATRELLSAALKNWARSFRDGDWHTYLALYAADFEYRSLDKTEWSAYRVKSAAARPIQNYSIDDVLLLADPEEDGLFLSRFRQTITDATGRIITTKRLYWRLMPDGALKIVAEDNG
jgi:murein L,D-transpeptidase YafK